MSDSLQHREFLSSSAYDLKASYQRNMLTSMFAVTLLAIAVAVSIWIVDTYFLENESKIKVEPIEVSVPWDESTVVTIPSKPTSAVAAGSSQPEVGIPEPVADETPVEETTEIESIGTGSDDSLACKYLQLETSYSIGIEYLPSDTEFVVFEKPAEVVELHRPEYPRIAQNAGLTGIVWIKTLVDRDGNPRESKIGKSSGISLLDQAALAAASHSIFKPAIQNGHPVATWVTYKVVFELEE